MYLGKVLLHSKMKHSKKRALWGLLGLALLVTPGSLFAEVSGGGRGGPFLEYHNRSLSAFDPEVSGNPVLIGGFGFASTSKKFRIGGGGGGGFLMNPSENVQFGLGYGGVVGEYTINEWLNARLLIGGGGYGVVKIISETETERVIRKLSTGGFFLFFPSVNAEIQLTKFSALHVGIGYFLPNVNRLDSVTVIFSLIMGKK